MKGRFVIVMSLCFLCLQLKAQTTGSADFRWGNGFYYNLGIGEKITFNQVEVELLEAENHYNRLRVGENIIWLKVSRRALPVELQGIRIFVADNKAVSNLDPGSPVHGLLTKDALICLSELSKPLLDPAAYTFPVSFNNGFTWNAEEDSYMFSLYKTGSSSGSYTSYPGIGFNLHDARGLQKHWLVAVENSRVVSVKTMGRGDGGNQSYVLLESESQSGIYYLYKGLYSKNLAVKPGQRLLKGDAVGTAWGDEKWGHLHFAVINSENMPAGEEYLHNIVNGFPQLFSLYFRQSSMVMRSFTRGKIVFGGPRHSGGNQLNTHEFEPYSGRGWVTGKWNPADKVEWYGNESEGNVRLNKTLFEGTPAQAVNPEDYYEYRITVSNGTYRIRAKVGDAVLASWQKIEFEGVDAGTKSLKGGDYSWTNERVVKVTDGTLNIRIYTDPENHRVAGLKEIVFQGVY